MIYQCFGDNLMLEYPIEETFTESAIDKMQKLTRKLNNKIRELEDSILFKFIVDEKQFLSGDRSPIYVTIASDIIGKIRYNYLDGYYLIWLETIAPVTQKGKQREDRIKYLIKLVLSEVNEENFKQKEE